MLIVFSYILKQSCFWGTDSSGVWVKCLHEYEPPEMFWKRQVSWYCYYDSPLNFYNSLQYDFTLNLFSGKNDSLIEAKNQEKIFSIVSGHLF